MRFSQKIILFLLASIPFFAYFFRSDIIGADTYWYINQACGLMSYKVNDFLFDLLNYFMPCNLFLMKLYSALLFVGFVFVFAKIGELLDREKGWWLGLIAISFTFIITEFFMYQNEPIAYFLFALSFYFIILYNKVKNVLYLVLSLLIWLISGLFWKGVIYWGITLIIYAPILIIVILPIIIYFWDGFWWFLYADQRIAFYTQFIGIIYLGVSIFFLFGLLKSSKKQILSFIFSLPMVVYVQRLYVIAVPNILIIAFNGLKSLKIKKETIEYTLIMFTLFISLFWVLHIYKEFPTQSDIELINNIKQKTNIVQNSFGPGYLLIYHGLKVSSYGWPRDPKDYNYIGYVILEKQIDDNTCPIILTSDNLKVLDCNNVKQ